MRISDQIAAVILSMLNEDGQAEIQRNELAGKLGCVPSQVNYVITSRFTPEQGYLVESKRGGGGYIRITRVCRAEPASLLMHLVNCIGETIDACSVRAIVENLLYEHKLSEQAARLILAALSEAALKKVPVPCRDAVRASILKQLLLVLAA